MCENLIFSNGITNLKSWKNKLINADIAINYMPADDTNNKLSECFDDIKQMTYYKGNKFQALKQFVKEHFSFFKKYRYIAILDDNIILNGDQINKIFEINKRFNLWVSQPSYKDHVEETIRSNPENMLHFTNYIEYCCPFFEINKLFFFLDKYEPEIVQNYNLEWLFIQMFGIHWKKKYAVIDSIIYNISHPCQQLKNDLTPAEKKYLESKKVILNYDKCYKNWKNLLLNPDIRKINGIDHIVWINLDRSDDRRKSLEKTLNRFNVSNTRISAVDGKLVNTREIVTTKIKDYFIKDKKNGGLKVDKLMDTEIATTLSHIKAINYINDLSGNFFMICEDDVSFKNINLFPCDLKQIITDAGDFDVLMLQKTIWPHDSQRFYTRGLYFPRQERTWGAVCYIITKKYASNISKEVKYNGENSFTFLTDKIFDVSDEYLYNGHKTIVYKYNFATTIAENSLIHENNLKFHNISHKYQQRLIDITYSLIN